MALQEKIIQHIAGLGILTLVLSIAGCESKELDQPDPGNKELLKEFPSFITPITDYFETRIGGIPDIKESDYQLTISGAIDNPAVLSLQDLVDLKQVEKNLTIECLGNPVNGSLLGTATWKGFRIYDLLASLGIGEKAITVKYHCADGYYTYNTIEELQNSDVIGALFMNGEPIPAKYGFPLRVIFPGYYGVRQPGWIVEMELLETSVEDYWSRKRWDTDSTMTVDSKFFFPLDNSVIGVGDTVSIGGAAYGGRRISSVEITVDDGKTWIPASISQRVDEDFVWVFWQYKFIPQNTGSVTIRSRATDQDGRIQVVADNKSLDGTNTQPTVTIHVE
jgi:hypothetical protein